jgi:hypothetical protein
MGDRMIIGFKESAEAHTLYLYGHWAGSEQLGLTRQVLEASRARWDDPAYATRIGVSVIVGDEWRNETGYGLSVDTFTYPDYPSYRQVIWDAKQVQICDTETHEVLKAQSFQEFLAEPALLFDGEE